MMQWRKLWLGVVMLVAVVAMTACGASAPAAPANTTTPAEVAVEPTVAVIEEAAAATVVPVEESASTAAPVAEAAAEAAERRTFVIDPAQSVVRFTLTEELMGTPTTVVGESSAIAGGVNVDLVNYANTNLVPFQIDAATFVTDNNFRNRAIRRFILQSEQPEYQYITFTPTAVAGLPDSAVVSELFEFTVTGDLTIRDVTQSVDFVVSVTPVSEMQLTGNARATVLRADFGLQIPDVPSVANVSDDVLLEIDFVAVAQ